MESALVSVGMGVMKPLLSKLYKRLKEEHSKLKGVRRQIEETREEMSRMEAALETLADAENLNSLMAAWRDDVRELSYDMEDCIDDFMARADTKQDGPKGFKGFFDKVKKLKPGHEIAGEIKELKFRAIEASKRHKRYKFDPPTPDSTTCDIDPRLHALYVDVGKLVGIDSPKKHIIEWFRSEDSSTKLRVLSIVGAGGLGKTTLAKAVYETIRSQFSCVAFVSVSRKPNMKIILREIATRFGITHNTSDGEQLLIDTLREHLHDKKYLVVVDDIWNTEACKTIRDALPNNDYGSRIICTTRNSAVASSESDYVYRVEPLNSTDSRRLFLERTFGSEDLIPPNLQEVSKKILKKCAGLPLAIITLSGLLKDHAAEEKWNGVLDAIGSSLANELGAGNMTNILSLSYFDLPHPMRTCLLYLSAYPEDHIIEKKSLIHKWMAEGFIYKERGRSAYEVGEYYFNDFINRSLIQRANLYSTGEEEYGQVLACRVHDIILDFITCKANEEHFMTSFDDVDAEHRNRHKVRRLSVMNRSDIMADVSGDVSHVRSLAIFLGLEGNSFLDFPFLRDLDFFFLRVLDLGECWNLRNHHLADIEKLLLLKYLRLPDSITEIPGGIGKLKYLETLDMRGVSVSKLPSTMKRLELLARLYVSFEPSCLSDGIIGQLQSLEELEDVSVLQTELEKFLQELAHLTKLRTLSVSVTDEIVYTKKEDVIRFVGTLISSHNIHHLRINCYYYEKEPQEQELLSLESWCPDNPAALRTICIHKYYIDKVPNWMRLLGNLCGLDLSMYCTRPEDIAILEHVPALAFLKLKAWYGENGRILIHGFRSLKYFNLMLSHCGTVVEFKEGSMPKLENLKLQLCSRMFERMDHSFNLGIGHLSALTKVDLFLVHGDNFFIHEIERIIETDVGKLRNRPTISLRHTSQPSACVHFKKAIKQASSRVSRNIQWYSDSALSTLSSYLDRLVQEIEEIEGRRFFQAMLEGRPFRSITNQYRRADRYAPFTFADMHHDLYQVQDLPSLAWSSPSLSIDDSGASSSAVEIPDNVDVDSAATVTHQFSPPAAPAHVRRRPRRTRAGRGRTARSTVGQRCPW